MILDGALYAEWDALLDDYANVENNPDQGSMEKPKHLEIAERMEAIREQVAASEVIFIFERVPWSKRLALQAEHPPREGNMADRFRGFNIETFYPALIRASCVAVKGADGDEAEVPEDLWDALLGSGDSAGSLNFKQVNQLSDAANFVNEGENRVPPSARSLLGNQDSGASLEQPSPGTSPRSDGEAGSPRGSTSTSTTKKARSKARSNGS
jgi:hypothetical protein